ncbi:hypothetical protein pb186bvf_014525 [Paramecium bursaria]
MERHLQKLLLLKEIFIQEDGLSKTVMKRKLHDLEFQIGSLKKQYIESARTRSRTVDQRKQMIATNHNLCSICNKYIFEKRIQLKCKHNFHEQCMIRIIKTQINQNRMFCPCGQKIFINDLDVDNIELKLLQKLYLSQQINSIKQQLPTIKCRSLNCQFFWARDKYQIKSKFSNSIIHKFCPYCTSK